MSWSKHWGLMNIVARWLRIIVVVVVIVVVAIKFSISPTTLLILSLLTTLFSCARLRRKNPHIWIRVAIVSIVITAGCAIYLSVY